MTPRPRKKGRRGWPDNLYQTVVKGTVYYRYKDPRDGQFHGMGTDYQRAAKATRLLNAQLVKADPSAEALAANIIGGKDTVADAADRWQGTLHEKTDKRGRRMADKTVKEYRRMLGDAVTAVGAKQMGAVSRRDIAEHLANYPNASANRRRNVLVQFFNWAVAEGLREDNPVQGTLTRVEVVQRHRLGLAAWKLIRAAAEPWFQNALDLAIQTLQRREDLVAMRFDHQQDGKLLVRQHKVEGHGTGNIRINAGRELADVIERCRDDVLSPFLIHRTPRRRRREYLEQKEHWTQVAPEMLTREFKRLRDACALYQELAPLQRPSFHEIRALGADLYREAGWEEAAIQRLLGHARSGTTELYLDRHRIRWVDADCGLQNITATD